MGREREEEYQTDEFKQDKDIYEKIEINTNSLSTGPQLQGRCHFSSRH